MAIPRSLNLSSVCDLSKSAVFDSLLTGGRFRNQLHIRFPIYEHGDSLAEQGMVVRRKDPN
jgi:hypothetical protein